MSLHRPRRLCVASVASVRAAPDESAEQVTQLVFGEIVSVEAERGRWLHIRTAYDYPGWVAAAAVSSGDPLTEARTYLGAPYEWGGMTAEGIDCSGLVHMAFRRAGATVPRDAHEQEDAGTDVEPADVRPGDLVTYGDDAADHIAFWVDDGRILHATARDGVARVVEEDEPDELARRRRKIVRLAGSLEPGSRLP